MSRPSWNVERWLEEYWPYTLVLAVLYTVLVAWWLKPIESIVCVLQARRCVVCFERTCAQVDRDVFALVSKDENPHGRMHVNKGEALCCWHPVEEDLLFSHGPGSPVGIHFSAETKYGVSPGGINHGGHPDWKTLDEPEL